MGCQRKICQIICLLKLHTTQGKLYVSDHKILLFILFLLVFNISGCQLLLEEREQFLKDPKINVSMTVKDTPPPVLNPDNRSVAVATGKTAPPEAALDKNLMPQPSVQADFKHYLAPDRTEKPRLLHNEADTADTIISGRTITEDLTLDGTVLVKGSLVVAPQTTLWVEAGSKIRFVPKDDSSEKPQLVVMGRLVVKGSAEHPVLLSSVFEKPVPGDWAGVLLLNSTKNNLIQFLEITGAQTGITANYSRLTAQNLKLDQSVVGLSQHDSTVTVDDLWARRCDIGIYSVESDLIMQKGVLRENRLAISAVDTNLIMEELTVRDNSQEGLLLNRCRFIIKDSLFRKNRNGIVAIGGEGQLFTSGFVANRQNGVKLSSLGVRIKNSRFVDNGEHGLMLENVRGSMLESEIVQNKAAQLHLKGTKPFSAVLNWWGFVDEQVIADGIKDAWHDSSYSLVQFVPYLSVAPDLTSFHP